MRTFKWSYLLVLLCAASAAQAQSVVPLKGQTSQQMQLDINDCNTYSMACQPQNFASSSRQNSTNN